MEIYEIQNKGKGVITTLVPNDLLLITDTDTGIQGLQDVIDVNQNLPFANLINVAQSLSFDTPVGGELGINNVSSTVDTPFAYIGKQRGNVLTDVSLIFTTNKALFRDFQNNRGLEYDGDYEANFLPRSLITKQYLLAQIAAIPPPDGSETKLISGTTTVASGNGTIATPYKLETVNLQKPITADYLLTAADNNYSIKVNNGSTPVTITVPTGLPENFFIGITQKGTADVTIVGSSTTINNPIGFKIKGQGFCVGLEQIGTTNIFDLLADTKA